MPEPDVHSVVMEWVEKAEHDLITAAHTLKLGQSAPCDTICFHAQQCVEKYLKAMLVFHGSPVPRTHDIESLVCALPHMLLAGWPLTEQRTLTMYAVVTRYPGTGEDISTTEARRAVRMAKTIRAELRRALGLPGRARQ